LNNQSGSSPEVSIGADTVHASRQATRALTLVEPIVPPLLHLLLGFFAIQAHVNLPLNNQSGSSPEVLTGAGVAAIVGEEEGPALGEADGFLDEVGEMDGLALGEVLGCSEVEGLVEGEFDGLELGDSDGLSIGAEDGLALELGDELVDVDSAQAGPLHLNVITRFDTEMS
jgi:hypothetical protein